MNKNNNSTYTYVIHSLIEWLIVVIVAYVIICYLSDSIYCDSISGNTNENDDSYIDPISTAPTTLIKYKDIIRRKLHWYFDGKPSGKFDSFGEFKTKWNPNKSLRGDFYKAMKNPMEDIRKTRANTKVITEKSLQHDANLINSTRNARYISEKRFIKRLNQMFNK